MHSTLPIESHSVNRSERVPAEKRFLFRIIVMLKGIRGLTCNTLLLKGLALFFFDHQTVMG